MKKTTRNGLLRIFKHRLIPLLRMPAFWVVTLLGNGFVVLGAGILYHFEKGAQPKSISMLDCLSWAVGLVTTIGYADLIPVTNYGKMLGIVMMVGGTLFLWSYMALIVGALLSPDISLIEREISGIKRETSLDERKLTEINEKLESLVQELRKFKIDDNKQ